MTGVQFQWPSRYHKIRKVKTAMELSGKKKTFYLVSKETKKMGFVRVGTILLSGMNHSNPKLQKSTKGHY